MNAQSEKVLSLLDGRIVSLDEILDNLKVLSSKLDDSVKVSYILTRNNKNTPWPAPYQAGARIDGNEFYCCSYSTLDTFEEDIKQLNVYRLDDG